MKTAGQKIAERSVALRNKYGVYPPRAWNPDKKEWIIFPWPEMIDSVEVEGVEIRLEPRDGHKDDVIPECPDYAHIEFDKWGLLPLNREDFRKRLRKALPRRTRIDTYSRRLNTGRRNEDETS